MLDVKKLVLLREVALRGSLTAASKSLKISASNISQRISQLEKDTGVKLLEQDGRGVVLTKLAKELVTQTEEILALLEKAETQIAQSQKKLSGTVRLITFHTFAITILGSVVKHLQQTAPGITLEFQQLDPEPALTELLSRRADIVVSDEYPGLPLNPATGVIRNLIGKEPINVYLPTGVTNPANVVWAMEPRDSDSFKWSKSVCRSLGFDPEVQFESPDLFVHKELLKQSIAAAFLPLGVSQFLPETQKPSDLFPKDLHRNILTLVRRGTQRQAKIAAVQKAVEAAFLEMVTKTV